MTNSEFQDSDRKGKIINISESNASIYRKLLIETLIEEVKRKVNEKIELDHRDVPKLRALPADFALSVFQWKEQIQLFMF